MTLASDNIRPGMYVSILETVTRRTRGADGKALESKQYGGAGAVLDVLAISHPFVLVRSLTPALLAAPAPFPIDLRRTRLTMLNREYAEAAIAQQPGPPPVRGRAIARLQAAVIPAMPFSWGASMLPAPPPSSPADARPDIDDSRDDAD